MKYALFILAAVLFVAGPSLAATTKYWDINGATAGASASATAAGTWDTGTTGNWSTDSTGSSATTTWAAGDSAVFAAGTNATGAYTVTASGTPSAAAITLEEGTVTLAGSAIAVNTGVVTLNAGTRLITANAGGATGTGITLTAGGSYSITGNAALQTTNTGNGGSFVSSASTIALSNNANLTVDYQVANSLSIIQTATVISGSGNLVKTGAGVIAIASPSTYNGTTTINGGELRVRTTANALPTTTAVTINSGAVFNLNNVNQSVASIAGSGDVGTGGATLTLTGSANTVLNGALKNIANAGAGAVTTGNGKLVQSGSGTTTFNGVNDINGSVTLSSGGVTVGSTGSLCGDIADVTVNGGTLTLNQSAEKIENLSGMGGTIKLNNASLNLISDPVASTTYSGTISGAGGLDRQNSNATTRTLTLSGNNTYDGNTIVEKGIISVGHANALGSTTGYTQVNASGAEILFTGAGGSVTTSEPFRIAGTGSTDNGAIAVISSATSTISGPVTLIGDATVTVSSSAGVTFNNANAFTSSNNENLTLTGGSGAGAGGTISGIVALGTGSLTKAQGGKWTLTAANTYSGGTKINEGGLGLGDKAALGTGTLTVGDAVTPPTATISLSAATDLSGTNAVANAVTVNRDFSITGSNKLELSGNMNLGAVNRTVTVTNSADTIMSGVIGDGGFGTGALSKAGSGKLILTNGSNSYGGGTIVSAGTLLVNNTTGSATGSGNIGVTGGVFGGTGAVSGSVSISGTGTLSPGASVESLATGALSFFAGSTLKYEIDSSAPLAAAADLLDANGGLSIAAGSLLTLSDVANTPVTVPVGTRFTMISYSGTWDNGTFNGAADDSVITLGGDYYVINYNDENAGVNFSGGSFSNFVTLTAVPEVNGSLLGGLVTLIVGFVIGGRKLINKAPAA